MGVMVAANVAAMAAVAGRQTCLKTITAAAMVIVLPAIAQAAEITVYPAANGGSPSILILGKIEYGDEETFRSKVAPLSGHYRVVLESPGGNAISGMEIGEPIRMHGWSTFVLSQCYSSCALAFLGGVAKEMAPDAQIGFHQASENGQPSGQGNALVGAYLAKLGYNYDAVIFATDARPEGLSMLTPQKARKIGIEIAVNIPPPPEPMTAAPVAPAAPVIQAAPAPLPQCVTTVGGGPDIWRNEAIACGYRTIKIFDRQTIATGRYIRRELMVEPRGTYHLIATEFDAFVSYGGSVCDFPRSGWSDCVNVSGGHFQLKPESIAWFVRIADGEDPDAVGPIPQAPTATTSGGPEKHQFRVANASVGFLYLRNGSGTTYQEIAKMPDGTTGLVGRCVKPEGDSKPFCEVDWQGFDGWASSCCLVDPSAMPPPPPPSGICLGPFCFR
jgi:hypothetical protein